MSNEHTRGNVLRSFSVEEDQSKTMLDAYLSRYPQFATDLVELSLELELVENGVPDIEEDLEIANFSAPLVKAALSGDNAKEIAKKLEFPRAIVAAFRDRTFAPETLPQSLVRRMAFSASIGKAQLLAYLCMPIGMSPNLSMKSVGKPQEMEKTSFTDFVADLGLDDAQKALLFDGGYDNGSD